MSKKKFLPKEKQEAIKERKWIKEREITFKRCFNCKHYGRFVRRQKAATKHNKKRTVDVYECDKHPGCLNTINSFACEDWE